MPASDKSIKVEGLNKLVKELKAFDPELTQELKATNRELAESLVPVARAKAPRRTGTLIDTIRAGTTTRSGVVRAGKKAVPYVGPIHFGWPAHRITPNPFLWDALDSRRSEIEREYVERVSKLVEAIDNG